MTLVTPPVEIPRDRFGRPLVIPPDGGKPVAYARCTSYIDVLEDRYNLQKWFQRMVALGLSDRPDLRLAVSANRDDKRELDRICEAAREAAAASGAATTGSALHALTEIVDRGDTLPTLEPEAAADLEAYRTATADLKHVHIEQFCVLDTYKVGGTPDRVVEYGGERYIADIKTGSVEWGMLKIAMQLSVYARSHTYDQATGERGIHGASTNRGLVIHLPAGQADPTLYWVDLEAGWEAVKVARDVREQRRIKFADLTEPFNGKPARPSLHRQKKAEAEAAMQGEAEADRIARMIRTCATADAVREVWATHEGSWTDALTETAREHIAGLEAGQATA